MILLGFKLGAPPQPPRPNPRCEEKSKGIPIVLEIVWCEKKFTAEKVLQLFGASLHESVTLTVISVHSP